MTSFEETRKRWREWRRAWRAENKERLNAEARARYAKNREKETARNRDWYKRNAERARARSKEYQQRNKERISARRRAKYAAMSPAERAEYLLAAKIRRYQREESHERVAVDHHDDVG